MLLVLALAQSPALTLRHPSEPGSQESEGRALLGTVVAATYEARLTGATTAALRGQAEFGTVAGDAHRRSFVITLGAYSEDGAIIFSGWDGAQPQPGTHPITDQPGSGSIQALIVTGSPTRPTGAFRVLHGTVTITNSSRDCVTGRFEMYARGYEASELSQENRELTVRGSFSAPASRR